MFRLLVVGLVGYAAYKMGKGYFRSLAEDFRSEPSQEAFDFSGSASAADTAPRRRAARSQVETAEGNAGTATRGRRPGQRAARGSAPGTRAQAASASGETSAAPRRSRGRPAQGARRSAKAASADASEPAEGSRETIERELARQAGEDKASSGPGEGTQ